MFKNNRLVVFAIVFALILVSFGSINILASDESQVDIEIDNGGDQQKMLSIGELIALHPMSPEEEAAIVHGIPAYPVIIDGVSYEPEGVALFNGQRLHFVTGKDGKLYAFTAVEGLEKCIQEQFGQSSFD